MTQCALNRYTCDSCAQHIITIDRDSGVTPFSLACLATANCPGVMRSSFYRDDIEGKPTFEWRKPTPSELAKASPAMRAHFAQGGLDVHRIIPARTEAKRP